MSSEPLKPAVPEVQEGVIVLSLLLLDPAQVKVLLLSDNRDSCSQLFHSSNIRKQ